MMKSRFAAAAALMFVAGALIGWSSCKGEKGEPGASSSAIAPTPTTLSPGQELPGIVIDILSVGGGTVAGGNLRVGDTISVTFTLRKKDGSDLAASELDFSQAYVSGPTVNYQRVIAPQANWHLSANRNSDGTWTYAFPVQIPSVYQAPDNYTGILVPGGEELVGQPLADGTYTVGLEAFKNYTEGVTTFRDPGNATKDFLFGGAGAIRRREVVKAENCNQCHVTLQAHGGFRRDPNLCVLCHVAGAEDKNVPTVEGGTPNVSIDLRVLIHKIHNGKHLPSVHGVTTDVAGDRVYGSDTISSTPAIGNAATTNFVFTLPALMVDELRAGGFSMTFTNPVQDVRTVTDDGTGNLIGSVGAGTNTINYQTGAVDVTFNVAPASGVPVTATVTSAAKGSYKVVGYQNSVHDYSTVGFPVWPSLSIAMPKDEGYSALTTAQKEANDEIRRGVVACDKCHGIPASGGTAPAQGSLPFEQPSRRACGSCHDDVVWTSPYVKNGVSHGAQADDSGCNAAACHPSSAVRDAHIHPIDNPTAYDSGMTMGANFTFAGLSGGTGPNGNFLASDVPAITFTLKDDAGTDIAIESLDSTSGLVIGPTTNRQLVMPYASASPAISPFDFAGRFYGIPASSPASKGSMSKVFGAAVSETLTVQFSSAANFDVTGSTSGALGTGTLPAGGALSTNPSGSSLSYATLAPSTAVAQTVQVVFTSPTDFAVTGSVSGDMGSGSLPASKNTSARFTASAGGIAFTLSVGTSEFAATNAFNMAVFVGASANPCVFAIVTGRGGATGQFSSPDRFHYETVAPAGSYTIPIPMDITLEFLGTGDGTLGQSFTAGNAPVIFGRQSLYEVTALGVSSSIMTDAPRFARFVSVNAGAFPSSVKTVVIDPGLATAEYVPVSLRDTTNNRLWFSTPLRFAHAAGATVQAATLTFRQEGAGNYYTLDAATGNFTANTAFTNGRDFVVSYRTYGRFGYRRFSGDSIQTVFQPPLNDIFNDSTDLGQDWGEWTGLPYVDGTYTATLWGVRYLHLAQNGEQQRYSLAAPTATRDFLFGGSAAAIVPRSLVAPADTCNACHTVVLAHGAGRRGLDNCLACHAISGAEDRAVWIGGLSAPATPGLTIDFRDMLHRIHRGEDLANASTYQVVGYGESPRTFGVNPFGEVVFPAMPGRTKHCAACHGTSTAWQRPAERDHASQTVPTRRWRAACGSCHDSSDAMAHIELNTSAGGLESCEACHGVGHAENVELRHMNR